MPYATLDDLVSRFGEQELIDQTDRFSSSRVDLGVVARALDDASATIDGYLAARYTLPMTSVPPLLVGVCCDLARYALYPDAAPDMIRDRYQNALRMLREIGSGSLQLGVGKAVSSGLSQAVSGERLFARSARG